MSQEPQDKIRGVVTDNVPLIRALIDAFFFLESAGPDEVDPDSAVRCMEDMASRLLTLSQDDQLALRAYLERFENNDSDSAYTDFVRAISDDIGLATP